MKVAIEKSFTFHSAHRLPNHPGKCSNIHGHTYQLDVKVSGTPLDDGRGDSGMVMDFGDLKEIVTETIIDKYDHQDLNNHFENPTAENMAAIIWLTLVDVLPHKVTLEKIRLWETETACAEVVR